MQANLEEMEVELIRAQQKAESLQMDWSLLKQEHATALADKDQHFEDARRNYMKQQEQLQLQVDAEASAKAEKARALKQLESEAAAAEARAEVLERNAAELQRQMKKLQTQLRDATTLSSEDQKALDEAREAAKRLERRNNELLTELDDLRERVRGRRVGGGGRVAEGSGSRGLRVVPIGIASPTGMSGPLCPHAQEEQALRTKKTLQVEVDELHDAAERDTAEKTTLFESKRKLELALHALEEGVRP